LFIESDSRVDNETSSELSEEHLEAEDQMSHTDLPEAREEVPEPLVSHESNFLEVEDFRHMKTNLEKLSHQKWEKISVEELMAKFSNTKHLNTLIMKELKECLRTIATKLKQAQIPYLLSWRKEEMVTFMHCLMTNDLSSLKKARRRGKTEGPYRPLALRTMCCRVVDKFPKSVLNVVMAEHLAHEKMKQWKQTGPFGEQSYIEGHGPVRWFTKPDCSPEMGTIFHMLDTHHLFVNARVKVCSSGMPQRGISRTAWAKVAERSAENKTGLNLALVDDLVDKQRKEFAQTTFSAAVEKEMRQNGDIKEANFCRLIRQWNEAEDQPGLSSHERITRRLQFRDWLLEGVNFSAFPPPGSDVRGVPQVMFEGLLTNIERRIQLYPYTKSGSFNPRALGSLEAENLFGDFQDLDPRGLGVLRPEDIPKALGTACELAQMRHDQSR
jgi:hypothetical protein